MCQKCRFKLSDFLEKAKGKELSCQDLWVLGKSAKYFCILFCPALWHILFFGSPAAESFEYLQRVSTAMLKLSFVYISIMFWPEPEVTWKSKQKPSFIVVVARVRYSCE